MALISATLTNNTLSKALALATAGQTISFTTSVSFSLQPGVCWQPILPSGVNLIGNCGPGGPMITIDGTGLPANSTGLVLNHNTLYGLAITHFPAGPQIQAPGNGSGNHLKCVTTIR